MIYPLVSDGHPLLRQKLDVFDFDNPPIDPVELSNNLIETMIENKGLGLSANQCGLPYRVFVMWSNPTKVCFNPRIVDQTSEQVLLDEGCLSYPNLFIKIKRPKVIKVRYQDERGEVQNEKFIGMTARCFLHELDHMDGVVYLERANRIHVDRARNQKKLLERQQKRTLRYGVIS
jgi:peptide deformylase